MSVVNKATFVLAVTNLDASRKFYTEKLGFHEDMCVEGWSFLSLGACHLRIGDCPGIIPMNQVPDHSWFAYLHVSNATEFFARCVKNEVQIWHRLEDKPWGLREFAIVTPDGHRIVFGELIG